MVEFLYIISKIFSVQSVQAVAGDLLLYLSLAQSHSVRVG
jgi:hypothetical protein